MSLVLASIHVYPIKSIGGFQVGAARSTDRGLEHDRRWMLVDEHGCFITQREHPGMACLHCSPGPEGFRVTDVRDGATIDLPWALATGNLHSVNVWEDTVLALAAAPEINSWFSGRIGITARLVFMPDTSQREVDPTYAKGITSFSDGFPYLIVSQASLNDLNARIPEVERIPMDRFRPNLVIGGGEAYQEDQWQQITIGSCRFALVKPCARCVITTTDQVTGARGKEPLRTLSIYRRRRASEVAKVDFGMNAMALVESVLRAGDPVEPTR